MINQELSSKISKVLDTRDKRFMFLLILFPKFVHNINLEGSSFYVAFEMVDYFNKQGMESELEQKIDEHFIN